MALDRALAHEAPVLGGSASWAALGVELSAGATECRACVEASEASEELNDAALEGGGVDKGRLSAVGPLLALLCWCRRERI